MRPYYECHITFTFIWHDTTDLKALIERDTGWKWSQIDGDPVLGPGRKTYLTKHFPASTNTSHTMADAEPVVAKMAKAAAYLRGCGLEVLREKVELVIYDTKSNSEIKSA